MQLSHAHLHVLFCVLKNLWQRCGKSAGKFLVVMKQCIFAGKPILKVILYWKWLIQGYSTYIERLRVMGSWYRDIFFPIFRKARPSFIRVLKRKTLVFNVTNLKCGKKTRVILYNTLKKEGRAFRNIGKNISLYCIISLANFRLLIAGPYRLTALLTKVNWSAKVYMHKAVSNGGSSVAPLKPAGQENWRTRLSYHFCCLQSLINTLDI